MKLELRILRIKLKFKKKEKCVLCGVKTPYTKKTPIGERAYYIEVAGQLCVQCGKMLES